jgi:uncharacterized membrane protein YqhA
VIFSIGFVLLRRTKLGTPWDPNLMVTFPYMNTTRKCVPSNVGLKIAFFNSHYFLVLSLCLLLYQVLFQLPHINATTLCANFQHQQRISLIGKKICEKILSGYKNFVTTFGHVHIIDKKQKEKII